MKSMLIAAALLLSVTVLHAEDGRASRPFPECTPALPYSCTTVRWAVRMFSRAYLIKQGKARGLTACMRKQAEACIAGAP